MKNKKIMFLSRSLEKGGGERILSEMSLNLSDNIQSTIVLLGNQVSYPYKGKLIVLDTPFSKKFFPKLFIFFRGFLKFKKVVNQEKPDYILSFGNEPNIMNVLIKRGSLVRVENFISKSNTGFFGKFYNFLIRLLFNRAERIIVVSKGIESELVKNFGIKKGKIQLTYNPIDVEKIQKMNQETLESKYQEIFKHPVLINIGMLNEQKGQWHLIRAFKKAKESNKNLKLVILGEGELKSRLQQLIEESNLKEDVHLLGWQENPFKFLSKSTLFVLSSLWEGLPTVILEAMACGIPILSADCKSGPREILAPHTNINCQAKNIEEEEYGILVPSMDKKFYKAEESLTKSEELLSEAIIKILADEKLQKNLRKKSKERAGEFDVKNIIKEWNFL